jgi:hypothetical protein
MVAAQKNTGKASFCTKLAPFCFGGVTEFYLTSKHGNDYFKTALSWFYDLPVLANNESFNRNMT